MSVQSPFMPKQGANQKVTATTTSSVVTIGAGQKSLRAMNAGSVVVYFRTFRASDGTPSATNADTALSTGGGAASVIVIQKPEWHDSVAVVADSTTSIVHFQPGEGGT